MEVLWIRDEVGERVGLTRTNPFSLLLSIGNTPLIQIRHMTRYLKGVEILAKAEWLNPGGSVKDRAGQLTLEYCSDCERQKKRLSVGPPTLRPSPP